jgi:hypothetical protein
MTGAFGKRRAHVPVISAERTRPAGAQEVLGADHPLARAEHRVRWLGRQAATLTAFLPVVAVLAMTGAPELRAVLPAGVVVEAWLLVALAAGMADVRERALDLIVEDRGALPVTGVQRRRVRLLRPDHIHRLAEAVEALRREARSPYARRPGCRPLYQPAVIRAADVELAAVARVLRAAPDAVTVGRVERLLGGARSPLYGDDSRTLREELGRIGFGAARAGCACPDSPRRTPEHRCSVGIEAPPSSGGRASWPGP